MKTANYYYWVFVTGVTLPSAIAWTGSPTPITNRTPRSISLLLRMSESDETIDYDYGRDYPRHHKFSRIVDPHTNNLDVDLAAVNSLINQRLLARENKDFRMADNILNQLLTRHAVVINDTNNTWKTGTKREVKKRKKVAPKVAALAGNNSPSNSSRSNHNHAYKLSPDAGSNSSALSDEDILARIGDRRQAQRDRDFEQADDIRHQLKVAGVYVEDGLKEWRADGVPFGTMRGKIRGHASTSPTSLVRSEYSLAFDNEDDDTATVNGMLAQRSKFKSGRRFGEADSIRDQLYESYNIRIDDKLGEWSVGGNFGDENNADWAKKSSEESLQYTKSATSGELTSEADEKYVQANVDERMRAKRTRNYEVADSIRDELHRRFNVTIHDKINEWSVGGDFGEDNSWTHVVTPDEELVDETEVTEDGGKFDDRSFESYYAGQDAHEKEDESSQEVTTPPSLSKEQLGCLTVVQLKEKLRDAGLTVSGTKAKLIDRLLTS